MSPVIVTLDAIAAAGRNVTFKTQFTTLGNIQVSEYGVVFLLKADFEPGSVPTPVAETHDRGIINKPASLNEETVMKKINGTPGTAVTYRAYAKLANGTTIYGAVKEVLLVM